MKRPAASSSSGPQGLFRPRSCAAASLIPPEGLQDAADMRIEANGQNLLARRDVVTDRQIGLFGETAADVNGFRHLVVDSFDCSTMLFR